MCDLPVQVCDRSTVSIVRWAWRRGRWSAPSTSSTSTRTLMVGGASTEHVTCIIVLTLDLAVAALCVCMCACVCVCGSRWSVEQSVTRLIYSELQLQRQSGSSSVDSRPPPAKRVHLQPPLPSYPMQHCDGPDLFCGLCANCLKKST